jgi:hypothetical protein
VDIEASDMVWRCEVMSLDRGLLVMSALKMNLARKPASYPVVVARPVDFR